MVGSKHADYENSEHCGKNIAIIAIGSNINAEMNISDMFGLLNSEMMIVKVSKFVKTKPIGIENQPDFTNGAVKVVTNKELNKLKEFLKEIEDKLGRDRNAPKFGPRTIDLDLVVWNGEIVHQEYFSREFVRDSVNELL
jgi:2-amino-4-hydroxy-6-hydroxymethyldihydropteridine diphosphokinase